VLLPRSSWDHPAESKPAESSGARIALVAKSRRGVKKQINMQEDRPKRRVKHEEDYDEDFDDLYDSPPYHERLNARSRSKW
jgi:hypothetical protein